MSQFKGVNSIILSIVKIMNASLIYSTIIYMISLLIFL